MEALSKIQKLETNVHHDPSKAHSMVIKSANVWCAVTLQMLLATFYPIWQNTAWHFTFTETFFLGICTYANVHFSIKKKKTKRN